MAEQNASINGSTGGNEYRGSTPEGTDYSDWDPEERELVEFIRKHEFARPLFIWMISAVEIPVMILTLFALCVLITSRRSAPVFVVHLILSDLIHFICRFMMTFQHFRQTHELDSAYWYSLIVGLYFMACVAVERYLLVSHPIWYKSHHSLKVCCVISVIVWFVPLIFPNVYCDDLYLEFLFRSIACLIPYPIVILCFGGTCRGLSRSISLTPLKRRLILGSLFLVLVTYTSLILPTVILGIIIQIFSMKHLLYLRVFYFLECLLFVNPLADCLLYLFMRPDVGGLMKSVHCCCRTDTHQNSTHRRDEHSPDRSGPFACCASRSRSACTSAQTAEIELT